MNKTINAPNLMKMTLLKDRRTIGLLNRVSQDVSQLKGDIGLLLGDTTKRAIPLGAREVSKIAREQLAIGQAYARSHLPKMKMKVPSSTCSMSIAGGALLVGVVAIGYFLVKDRVALARRPADSNDDVADPTS